MFVEKNKVNVVASKNFDPVAVQNAFTLVPNQGDFDGSYGLQCVDLTKWFVHTYTTLEVARGNGDAQAKNIADANSLPTPSSIPVAPAAFSVAGGIKSFGGGHNAGHTGIVLSVDTVNKTATVLHTQISLTGESPNSKIDTFSYPADGVTFTYLGDYLKD